MIRTAGRVAAAAIAAGTMAPAYAADPRDDFPPLFTVSPTGVNIQTGRFTHSATDLSIGPLSFTRTWGLTQSFASVSGRSDHHLLGYWKHNFGFGVANLDSGEANVFIETGRVDFYYDVNSGSYTPSVADAYGLAAIGMRLTFTNNRFTLVDRQGNVYYFIGHQATGDRQIVEHIDYADGTRHDFSYDTSARLRTVRSSRGYALVLDYGSNGLLATVCGYNSAQTYVDANSTCAGAARKVSYTYWSGTYATRLASVTDAMSNVVSYTYDDSSNVKKLLCITLPNSSSCAISNTYGPLSGEDPALTQADQVRRQTTATGELWQFRYDNALLDPTAPPQPGDPVITGATMTDPLGQTTYAEYDRGQLKDVTDASGMTSYAWSGLELTRLTHPNGIIEMLSRDLRQNVRGKTRRAVPNSGLSDIVVTIEYDDTNEWSLIQPKKYNKPLYRIDERLGRTDYEYSGDHGQILTETGPDLGGGLRAQTRYSYVQRTPWLSNGVGGYYAAPAIWVLSEKRFCKTGFASGSGCASGGDEVVTSYDYGPDSGPNNLLVRGIVEDATGQALRTCYVYDAVGNKIAETKPRASLASCS